MYGYFLRTYQVLDDPQAPQARRKLVGRMIVVEQAAPAPYPEPQTSGDYQYELVCLQHTRTDESVLHLADGRKRVDVRLVGGVVQVAFQDGSGKVCRSRFGEAGKVAFVAR